MVVGHPGHLGERLACNGRIDDDKLPHKSLVVGGSITGLQVGRLYEKLAQEHHGEDYSNDALYAALSEYVSKEGVKTGFVMWPIRTAVSGKQMTPAGATEIMEVLGKEESISRIKKGIELLEAQQ